LGWRAELVERGDPFGGGEDEADGDAVSSWLPLDLFAIWDGEDVRATPEIMARIDGHAMFYPGKTHSVHGESESGKSWIAQVAVIEALRAGDGAVLYLDYEDDEHSVVARLRALGMRREWLTRFDYVAPDGPRDAAFAELLERSYRLAVIDGVTAAIAAEPDAKSSDNDNVTAWDKALPRRIAHRTGAAVVLVDHVTKSGEGRGRFPIGAQAKMANVSGSAFYVDVENVLRPGELGVLRIYVGKDRPGGVREHAGPMGKDRLQPFARFLFDAADPEAIAVELQPWMGAGDAEIYDESIELLREEEAIASRVPPPDVLAYEGSGRTALVDVAVVVMRYGSGASGVTLAKTTEYYAATRRELGDKATRDTFKKRVHRAWDALHALGHLEPVNPDSKIATGAHRWAK